MTFVEFITQAMESFTRWGTPVLEPGDILVVDNATIHHNEAENIVGNFLKQHGIELVYLPPYSPQFNPCENAFNKVKIILKDEEYAELIRFDVKTAVLRCFMEVTAADCIGFYNHTGYLSV